MSGSAVFRRALSILGETQLPPVATADLLAVLEDSRPGPLDFGYYACREAKLDREATLLRGAAAFFNHCAGQIADDISDGGCDYLDEPLKSGPAAQFILQNLFFATLARAGTRVDVVEKAATDMARAAGPQLIEVRTREWTAPLAIEVAEGIAGLQYAAYLRIYWSDTPLEADAPEVGRALGVALHFVTDIRSADPRYTTLSPPDRETVKRHAMSAADSLRWRELDCASGLLVDIDAVLSAA